MTKLIGFEKSEPRPNDLVQVPIDLFEAMHKKMAVMARYEAAIEAGVFDLDALISWEGKQEGSDDKQN